MLVAEGNVGKQGKRRDSCSANHISNKNLWISTSNQRAEHTATTTQWGMQVPTPETISRNQQTASKAKPKQTRVRGGWEFAPTCELRALEPTSINTTCINKVRATCELHASYMRATCEQHASNMRATCELHAMLTQATCELLQLPTTTNWEAQCAPKHVHDNG